MNSVQATVLLAIITISGNVLEIMADVPKINDLASVIEPHLNGTKLVNYTSRYLTKPGDNYASLVIAITAKVQKPSGEIEVLPLVAKLAPTSEDLLKIFAPKLPIHSEIIVYQSIIPELRLLQFQAGIQENDIFDRFAKYYGSRISLNPNSTKVDHDAVLVLENLQTTGFKAGKRQIPFNMAEIKLILGELAKFHSLSRLYLTRFFLVEEFKMKANLSQDVNHIKEKIQEHEEHPFQVLVHNDFWKNNIMLKYDESGRPIKVKFIGFHYLFYDSCVKDVIRLLFTSVENPVLEYRLVELLRLYYEAFIEGLKSLNISIAQYSFDSFITEINEYAPKHICRAILGVRTILADGSPFYFKYINREEILRNSKKKSKVLERMANLTRIAKKYGIDVSFCEYFISK